MTKRDWSISCFLLIIIAIYSVGIFAAEPDASGSLVTGNEQAVGPVLADVKLNTDVFKSLEVNDAKDSKAVFKMYSPVALSKEKLFFSFNEVCGNVKDYSISISGTCYNDVTHYNSSTTESCNNDTSNDTISCINQTVQTVDYVEQVPYICWQKVDSIPAGNNDYKIDADIAMAVCDDGNLGYKIDWIPSLNVDSGKTYSMADWAWWNASYKYKMYVNISNFTSIISFYINGSKGVNIDGTLVYPLASTSSGNVSLYYNSAADYVVVENDSIIQASDLSTLTGLKLYYKMDNDTTKGTTCIDTLGHNNATISGTPKVNQTGFIKNAYNLTTGKLISDNAIGVLGDFTALAIINKDSTTGTSGDNIFFFGGDSGKSYDIGYITGYGNYIIINAQDGGSNYYTYKIDQIIPSNTWITFAYTRSGTTQHAYINGIEVSIVDIGGQGTPLGLTYDSEPVTIGDRYSGTNYNFHGLIDEGSIWNRTLSSTAILEEFYNYNSTLGYGNVYDFATSYIANESFGRESILVGILQSKIGSSFQNYTDQKLYERLLNGSQYNGTFDYFVVSGNKRYVFNYDQNTSSNLPTFYNISPVLYVWQRYNMSYIDIQKDVKSFIDSTYS